MKATLTMTTKGIWYFDANDKRHDGKSPIIRGDVSGISGDVSGIRGDVSGISGDASGLSGDVSGIMGDVSGIMGDVDSCEITDAERESCIDISKLIIKMEA